MPNPAHSLKLTVDLSPFAAALSDLTPQRRAELDALVLEATVPSLRSAMAQGALTSEELVVYYIDRIRTYDINGLNAVIALNPDLLTQARAMDAQRSAGVVLGPLHGIPVLIKDNIAAAGAMPWTAGAWALRDMQPDRDAFLVAQVRDAGALILGKSNLSEFANWMDPSMPNGFSTLGGQTHHPYGLFDPLGSSTGSAVAVAANLAAVAVGTETSGSIISPASVNGIVGLKPSRGLISRDYIIPLLEGLDTAGPMGRTVTDVAVLLTAMVGADPHDPATAEAVAHFGTDYSQFLTTEGVDRLRVGYFTVDADMVRQASQASAAPLTDAEIEAQVAALNQQFGPGEAAMARLQSAGFTLVPVPVSAMLFARESIKPYLLGGVRHDLDAFLGQLGAVAPYATLAEIIAVTAQDAAQRAPYGLGYLIESQNTEISAEAFAEQVVAGRARAAGQIDGLLAQFGIAVLARGNMLPYPLAGYPAITLPVGVQDSGEPQSMVLAGGLFSEPQLIQAAYALEAAGPARVTPNLEARLAALAAQG